MTRNLAQLERTALAFLRQARENGITDDDEIIAEAAMTDGP